MIAAPFSAIMMVGALVLVEVTAGITEASMTLSPSVTGRSRERNQTAGVDPFEPFLAGEHPAKTAIRRPWPTWGRIHFAVGSVGDAPAK
jgi:hypothetical protein